MSGKPDDKERLNHIVESVDRIKKFTGGMDYDEFANNEMAQFAVIKNFEIIGEAAYHLTDELKRKYPEIEWKKIQAFRHILAHDYYRINLEIVWKSKENKIDDLRRSITEILKAM